jgi:hypothetical protein
MSQTTILSDEDLQEIYTWVDQVPLSRAKRNITRDFSDGVLLSEVLYHYFPKMVELKNYSAANSVRQKLYNWQTLNNKVRRGRGSSWPNRARAPWAPPPGGPALTSPTCPLLLSLPPTSSSPLPPLAGLSQASLPH